MAPSTSSVLQANLPLTFVATILIQTVIAVAILARMHANIDHAKGIAENNKHRIDAGILPRAEERITDIIEEIDSIKAALNSKTRDRFYRSEGNQLLRRIEKIEDRLVDHGHRPGQVGIVDPTWPSQRVSP